MSKYKLGQEVFFDLCGMLGKGTISKVITEEAEEETIYSYDISDVQWWSIGLKDFDSIQKADIEEDVTESEVFLSQKEAEDAVETSIMINRLSSLRIAIDTARADKSFILEQQKRLPMVETIIENAEKELKELEQKLYGRKEDESSSEMEKVEGARK